MVVVVTAVIIYLTALPLLFLIYGSLVDHPGSFSLTASNFIKSYGDFNVVRLFSRSMAFAFGSSLVAILLGGLAAWFSARTVTPLKGLLLAGSIFSLAVPSILNGIAWVSLAAPKSGLLNLLLRNIFGLDIAEGPLNIYSLPGMVWAEGVHGAALAYLLIWPILNSMDRSLEESSRMSGASMGHTIARITIPLAFPALISVFLLRFVRGLEAFDIPAIIGLPAGIDLLTTRIYTFVELERSYGAANAFSLGLMALGLLVLYGYQLTVRKTYKFATITGKGFVPLKINLGKWRMIGIGYIILYLLVVAVLPLLVIFWQSLFTYYTMPSLAALSRATLGNYQAILKMPEVLSAYKNSLLFGIGGSVICMFLASVTSWIVVRTRARGRELLELLSFTPLTIPGITMGVALVWIYLTLPIPVYGTFWIFLIGYTTEFLPQSMRFVSPALVQINKELEDSAHICGASWWDTFRKIILPLIMPAVLGGGIYVFLLIFRVLAMVIVIYTPDVMVVSVLTYVYWAIGGGGNRVYAMLIMSTLLMIPFTILYYWLNKRYGLRGAGG